MNALADPATTTPGPTVVGRGRVQALVGGACVPPEAGVRSLEAMDPARASRSNCRTG